MRLRCVAAGIVILSVSGVLASGREHSRQLDALIAEALRNNPEILAAQKRYEAARQRPSQESTLPDPVLGVGYQSAGSPRPVAGLGAEPMANAGFSITQEFPAPGKLNLRGGIAAKEAEAEFQQYQAVQLNVIARLKQAYYRLYYTYAARDVLERNRDLLTRLLSVTEARYAVGKAAQQDVLKAQTQISILETRLVKLEQERNAAEAEINSLLNRRAGTPVPRPEEFTPIEFALNLEELYGSAREQSPVLRRGQKMIERSELALNLARKDYYPDYAVTAGYFNQGSMPAMYMARVDVRIPLYFWRKQRPGVTEQASNLVEARRSYESIDQNIRFRIKDDYLMAQASWKLMELYSKTVIPQAGLALESSLSSYETGNLDFLSVLTNFTTVLDYELNYYQELMSYYAALSRLEELTALRLTD
ncbi:MAG TPA: TolC family protein [Bryobacteraceae bacterium]|nr:TolC family protein [Bryobacteraceae bacterium]HOQ44566.1 TolC family protein [Bryobacteraceae bacterium]HPQ15146.1 TolC family protein [Bryobacteraceae bacterium]HPU70885.1 TolC family protein [Bryobacteraceae bacterium]